MPVSAVALRGGRGQGVAVSPTSGPPGKGRSLENTVVCDYDPAAGKLLDSRLKHESIF